MNTATATFRAIADFSELRKQAAATRTEFSKLEQTQPKVQRAVQQTTTALSEQGQVVQSTGRAIVGANKATAGSMRSVSSASQAARNGFNGVAQAASNMLSSVNPAAGALSQVAASLGAVGSAAATAVITLSAVTAAVGAMGLSFLATREQALIAFTSILKDGAKAEDLINRITKTAAVTPFQTSSLVTSVRRLLAFGFELEAVLSGAGKEAEGLVVTIGDTVAAMGGSEEMINNVTRAFGQMFTRGKVTQQELTQLTENGIPALEILREELGLTAEELGSIGDQGIAATEGIAALVTGLEKRFGGAMEAQAKTAIGLISTLKDNFQLLSGAIAAPAFEPLKNALKGVTDILGEMAARSQEVGFFTALEERAPGAVRVLNAVISAVRALIGVARAAGPGMRELVSVLGNTTGRVAVATFTALAEILNTIAHVIDQIPDPLQRIIAQFIAFSMVARRLSFIRDMVTGLGTGFLLLIGKLSALTAATSVSSANMTGFAATTGVAGAAMDKTAASATRMGAALSFSSGGAVAALAAIATAAVFLFDVLSDGDDAQSDVAEANRELGEQLKTSTAEILANADALKVLRLEMSDNQLGYVSLSDAIIDAMNAQQESADETNRNREFMAAFNEVLVEMGGNANDTAAIFAAFSQGFAGVRQEMVLLNSTISPTVANFIEFSKSLDQNIPLLQQIAMFEETFGTPLGIELTEQSFQDLRAFHSQLEAIDMLFTSLQGGEIATTPPVNIQAMATEFLNAAEASSDLTQNIVKQAQAQAEANGMAGDAVATYLAYAGIAANLGDEQSALAFDLDAARRANAQWTDEMDDAGDSAEETTRDVEALEKAAEEAAKAWEEFEDRAASMNEAFASFTDVGGVFAGVFADVTDAGREAAENAALNAGLSKDAWTSFAYEAGIPLKAFADTLEAQIIAQQEWGQNLLAVAQQYGPEVAQELEKLGPEAAGIVKQMVDDTSGEGDRLAGLLKADAAMGSQELANEWQVGMDALKEIIENPDIDPAVLADKIGVPLAGLKGVVEKYGGPAGAAWMTKFQASLRSARVTFSTSQITVTGSPVKIPAIISVTTKGTVNPNIKARGGFTNAAGLWSFASGGLKPGDRLPDEATINRRAGTLVQWAEPETGGEAFIPLSPAKRNRSLQIWFETGRMLGAIGMRTGGIMSFAGGSPFGTPGTPVPRPAQFGLGAGSTVKAGATNTVNTIKISSDSNTKAVAEDLEEIAKNKWEVQLELGDTTTKLNILTAKINELRAAGKEWTDEWVDMQRKRGDALGAFVDTVTDAADNIKDLVDRELELQKDLVEAQTEANESRAEAQADFDKDILDLQEETAQRRTELEEGYAKDVTRLNKDLAAELEAINKDLNDQIKDRSDAFFGSISAMERFRAAWGSTTGAVIENLQQQNVAFKQYNASLQALKQRGATDDVIEALGLGDITQMDQVNKLLQATPEEFQKLLDEVALRRKQADILAQNSRADLDRAAAEATAEALSNASEAQSELRVQFNQDLQQLLTDQGRAMSDLQEQLNENFVDIAKSLLETQKDIQVEMQELGMETGVTYADALATGLNSSLPGVKAAAEEYRKVLNELLALAGAQGANPVTGTTPQGILDQFGVTLPAPPPPPAAAGPGAAGGNTYTIKWGDSWWKMAQNLWGDGRRYKELAALNGVSNVNAIIRPGQIIRYAGGGMVPGSGRGDKVLAALEPGEGVLNRGIMKWLSSGRMFDFATGRTPFSGVGGSSVHDTMGPDGDIVVPVTLLLDGEVVTRVVTRRQLRDRRTAGLNTGARTSVG